MPQPKKKPGTGVLEMFLPIIVSLQQVTLGKIWKDTDTDGKKMKHETGLALYKHWHMFASFFAFFYWKRA